MASKERTPDMWHLFRADYEDEVLILRQVTGIVSAKTRKEMAESVDLEELPVGSYRLAKASPEFRIIRVQTTKAQEVPW